jgi:hypothetical protein
MNKIRIILNTLILAVFIYYDTKNILFMLIGFSIACIFGYWQCRILPTKKHMMFLVYPIILGLLLKLIF